VQTPRFCGEACRAGTVLRAFTRVRGLRINWLIVGIAFIHPSFGSLSGVPLSVDQPFGRPNAQNGGAPSAPGAVGAHPFQMIASRKRRAIIT
jgi:hypothetical protein